MYSLLEFTIVAVLLLATGLLINWDDIKAESNKVGSIVLMIFLSILAVFMTLGFGLLGST
jgi:hypothetical protein